MKKKMKKKKKSERVLAAGGRAASEREPAHLNEVARAKLRRRRARGRGDGEQSKQHEHWPQRNVSNQDNKATKRKKERKKIHSWSLSEKTCALAIKPSQK